MKKILSITVLMMLLAGCSKSSSGPQNKVALKFNGVQQVVDSVNIKVFTGGSTITGLSISAHLNHIPAAIFYISLLFPPSDPGYGAGTTIDINANSALGIDYVDGVAEFIDEINVIPPGDLPNGSFTFTKNDVANRRIEGTLNDCVAYKLSGTGSTSFQVDGSFAVTYATH